MGNRIIDLSYTAAARLDMIRNGTAFVDVETLMPSAPAAAPALPVTSEAAAAASAGLSSVPPVTGPLPSAPVTPVAAPAPSGHFYIQVGAFAQAENARRVAQKLRDAGLSPVFTLAPDPEHPLQRVRIGPIASVQEFDQLTAQLSTLGFPEARLAQD